MFTDSAYSCREQKKHFTYSRANISQCRDDQRCNLSLKMAEVLVNYCALIQKKNCGRGSTGRFHFTKYKVVHSAFVHLYSKLYIVIYMFVDIG